MWRIENSKAVKVALFVCIIMQAVALMPHHHHEDSDTVCLNYTHLQSADCHDVCADEHDHEDHPYTSSCTSYNIVIVQPETGSEEIYEVVSDIPDSGIVFVANVDAGLLQPVYDEFFIKHRDNTCPVHYLRAYITDACPTRAPDFIA